MRSRRIAGSLYSHHKYAWVILFDCLHDCISGLTVLHNASHRESPISLNSKLLQRGCPWIQKCGRLCRATRMHHQERPLEDLG